MTDTTGKQAEVINSILLETAHARNVHLLTDIPANAARYKESVKSKTEQVAALEAKDGEEMQAAWGTLDPEKREAFKKLVMAAPTVYPKLEALIRGH